MFEAPEEAKLVGGDGHREDASSSLERTAISGRMPPEADPVKIRCKWEIIRLDLRAITNELDLLEDYFMKGACNVRIGAFTPSERQKLLNLFKELDKLAQLLKTGYCCQRLESREDFENELKTFKNDFKFMLRKLPPSPRMLLGRPEPVSEQMSITTGVVRDVKRILTAHFSKQLCWRDILEQVAAIILFVSDILSDWSAVLYHFENWDSYIRAPDRWRSLVNIILTLVIVHLAAFRTACTYVSNKLLIPLYTILPFLPVQVMTRQLYTCFKFKRKPEEINFKAMIRYHSVREDLIFIHSSQVLPGAFAQLILQGCTLLNLPFSRTGLWSPLWGLLIASVVTSLLNLCYACSRRSLFEFTSSSRYLSASYFGFFLLHESSRIASSIMLFVFTPWWFSVIVCLLRFLVSLVWLCMRIDSSYNIRFTFIGRITSSLKGSVILTSIPMLCYWSDFPLFWMDAVDIFGCMILSIVENPSLIAQFHDKAILLVASVIVSWFAACIIAFNTASLNAVYFGRSSR